MEGNYKVIVKYGGQEVPKSPFTVFVEGKVGDPTKCFASGPGIEPNGVIVDKPTWFEIDATGMVNDVNFLKFSSLNLLFVIQMLVTVK